MDFVQVLGKVVSRDPVVKLTGERPEPGSDLFLGPRWHSMKVRIPIIAMFFVYANSVVFESYGSPKI